MIDTSHLVDKIDEIYGRDLILVRTKQTESNNLAPVLGIFDRKINNNIILFRPIYYLRDLPQEDLGECKYIVSPKQYKSMSIRHIRGIHIESEKILTNLGRDERLKHHCDWISKLTKPYEMPKLKTVLNLPGKSPKVFKYISL